MSQFVKHPLIRPGSMESRLYQERILGRAAGENLLVVLPTGLGKTPIAVMLAAHRLRSHPGSCVLVLSPTKPLAAQHCSSFRKFLVLPEGEFEVLTGEVSPSERAGIYGSRSLIFATPQTIRNDIASGRLSLERFSLVVFDEAHHSIGGYAYPFIAKHYLEAGKDPRILALSASPGASQEKIREICGNLGVKAVDIRSETDSDVTPYVKRKDVEYARVQLPASFVSIRDLVGGALDSRLSHLRKFGYTKPVNLIGKKDLLALQGEFMGKLRSGNRTAFAAVSLVSQCIKLEHALGLVETQGIRSLEEYWRKVQSEKSRTAKSIVSDPKIAKAVLETAALSAKGSRHPKVSKLCSIVDQELSGNPQSRIIVFASYRTSVDEIVRALGSVRSARPVAFVGQKGGITQKQQMETIAKFREGAFNVLVATSVGEEGLDIPSANIAVFYEPVPSPLRAIQRRGRVGRASIGRVVMLITEGTRDEGYFWTAQNREKRMKTILRGMKRDGGSLAKESNLGDFC